VLSLVLRTIREQGLLAKGERVLVAVSGGPDSTALLHGLHALAARLGITLAAASVDHGLRPEAAGEAREVKRRCQTLGVACAVLRVDVRRARRPHVSVQEAARYARLAALERAAARLGCSKIALGHTADDQAETVLFRIVRGTGIAGLAGIPYQRGAFVRPLLDVRRAQILAYLAKRKLPFFSDPSNLDRHYARPRVRHDLLPILARENPRIVEGLVALAREARGEPARSWRKSLPPDLYLSRRTVATIDRLVRAGAGTRTVVVSGGAIEVSYGKLSWVPLLAGSPPAPAATPPLPRTLAGPGTYRLAQPPAPGIEITRPCTGAWPRANAACFDPAKLRWPLVLRGSRPGDRMAPRGGRGHRKLSDLLIDAKIGRQARTALPLLCDAAGTILFVPGLRPSECGRPDADTRRWFEVRVAR
jgi:tRNA(Ile)-lysidine synthase